MIQFLLVLVLSGSLSANPRTDFNRDGVVDFQDFLLLAQQFGTEQFDKRFDLDSNGELNLDDFMAFAEVFGTELSASKKADIPKNPKAEKLEEQAKGLRARGEYTKAIETYEKFMVLATDSLSLARGYKEIGLTYLEADSLDQAIQFLEKVLIGFGRVTDKQIRYELAGCSTVLGQAFYMKQDSLQAAWHWNQINLYLK